MAKKSDKTRKALSLQARRDASVRMGASPIQGSAPPVRIVGSSRRYRGGYCLNY